MTCGDASRTLTAMDYDDFLMALRETQRDRCGICGHALEHCDVVLDHDHRSGMVRGWLCKGCNTREARHGDECRDWIECTICSWRYRPATSWLGVTTLYQSTWANSPTWRPGRLGTADEFQPTSVSALAIKADRERVGRARAEIVGAVLGTDELVAAFAARVQSG